MYKMQQIPQDFMTLNTLLQVRNLHSLHPYMPTSTHSRQKKLHVNITSVFLTVSLKGLDDLLLLEILKCAYTGHFTNP